MYWSFHVRDLGPIYGDESSASAINNASLVVGASSSPTGWSQATSWVPDPAVYGMPVASFVSEEEQPTRAIGVDDLGVIVGVRFAPAAFDNLRTVATEWTGSKMVDLYGLGAHFDGGAADVNNNGWITGTASIPDAAAGNQAFIWKYAYEEHQISVVPDGSAFGTAINNGNRVVGAIERDGRRTAALWDFFAEHPESYTLPNDGVDGDSAAEDINDSDVVVGYATMNGVQRPTRWTLFKLDALELPALASRGVATGINNYGQIVGFFMIPSGNAEQERAFLYDSPVIIGHGIVYAPPRIVDLNTLIHPGSGWQLRTATGINDLGQICGNGTLNGKSHGFRLDPIGPFSVPAWDPNQRTVHIQSIFPPLPWPPPSPVAFTVPPERMHLHFLFEELQAVAGPTARDETGQRTALVTHVLNEMRRIILG